ncbi:MAG: hypothetical protein HQ538_01380 [Parcubacteria group bacterium]|nr:hypothetical protein [Parcubacteria group bacterium]
MPQIEISETTLEKIKSQFPDEMGSIKELESLDDLIGEKYFIRTVTYHCVGKITQRLGHFIILKEASVIFDSGKFSDAIKNGFGESAEIETVGQMILNLDAITDMFSWEHKLPKKTQ